jgi:hypothetical protein
MTLHEWVRSAGVVLAIAACSGPEPDEPPAVPAVQAERIPVPPPSNITQIWQPGHWEWDGQSFAWQEGEWVPREGHGPLWQDGYWRRAGASFTWVPAHWM